MNPAAAHRNALPLQSMLQEYRIEQVLGAGGFGISYLAADTHLEKRVAIKEYFPAELAMRSPQGEVLATGTQREPDYRWGLERFLQEARTLAKFSHAHIVRVLRYFAAHGTAYMVMDYEAGEALKARLQSSPQPPEAELKRLAAPLLEGLSAVHASGILHRDIKPDNIVVRPDGSPVLIDFGAARHALAGETRSLTAVLTPGYAPLEQYSGQGRQGPWTDLYALGGVLYRAVTGDAPPDAVARMKGDVVLEKLMQANSRYSEAFLNAIGWALELDEKRRPQSVEQWQGPLLQGARQPDATVPYEKTVRLEKPKPRRWRWVAIAGIVLLIVLVAAAWMKRKNAQKALPPEIAMQFRAADANGDGYLSMEEARRNFPFIARNFPRVDADGDGRLSPQEFLKVRRAQLEQRLAK